MKPYVNPCCASPETAPRIGAHSSRPAMFSGTVRSLVSAASRPKENAPMALSATSSANMAPSASTTLRRWARMACSRSIDRSSSTSFRGDCAPAVTALSISPAIARERPYEVFMVLTQHQNRPGRACGDTKGAWSATERRWMQTSGSSAAIAAPSTANPFGSDGGLYPICGLHLVEQLVHQLQHRRAANGTFQGAESNVHVAVRIRLAGVGVQARHCFGPRLIADESRRTRQDLQQRNV